MSTREYDVVVVGAGPAGASAAASVARTGLRVALLDRVDLPRDRACGGALVGPSLATLADLPPVPALAEVTKAAFSLRGGPTTLRDVGRTLMRTVDRAEFDDWLAADAVDAGADLIAPCTVLSVSQTEDDVVVSTSFGEFTARVVIAADGPLGVLADYVGVVAGRVDLGITLELDAGPLAKAWVDRAHFDFGPVPGSYGWIYPRGDTLDAGVVADRAHAADARKYLWQLLRWQRVDWMPVLRESGRVIRSRADDSPLTRGRVIAVGEAAGLVDAWAREGISYALRSGRIAGEIAAIAVIAESTPEEIGVAYEDALSIDLLPELADGALCLAAFERRPAVFHQLLTRTSVGWRTFRRIAADETAIARLAHTGDFEGVVAQAREELLPAAPTAEPSAAPGAVAGGQADGYAVASRTSTNF